MEHLNDRQKQLTQEQEQWVREWYAMMERIWRDRLDLLGVFDTGALRSRVSGAGLMMDGLDLTATFQFLEYGIYVDAGTGNGYKRGNGGDLQILDETYRYEHKMGKKREKKPGFSPSWYISTQVLKEKLGDFIGEQFVGAFDNLE